jgi:hypothetical protein
MKKRILLLIVSAATIVFSSTLMGAEFIKDSRLEAMCFEKARYESTYTKGDFSFLYHFEPILIDLFQVDDSTQKVNFTSDLNLIKNSELRAMSHAFVILNDWLQLKCFANDYKILALVKKLREEILKSLSQIYPNLSSDDKISLLYLAPWFEQSAWPYKKSDSKNRFEFLKEIYTSDVAARIDRIYNSTKVGIYIQPKGRDANSWVINVLTTVEKEFLRFNKGEKDRLKRVLPTLEILSIYQNDDESGNGHPNYQGIEIGVSENFNPPALVWLLWHESGHLFDSSSPSNSDYIANNFCSVPREASQKSSIVNSDDYERSGILKSFGTYNDFFTSEYSPDEYRRTKNFELVSYQCNSEWSESLRQSHYNRGASEQIADDFAHFIMYPGRYFFEKEVVAPLTFKFFEEKLQTNYLSSYTEVFQNTSLHGIELEKSEILKAIWIKNSVLTDEELHAKVSLFFKLRSALSTDPME